MNSVSFGTGLKRPCAQSSFACSRRSLLDETKFHQMMRGPSIASPPSSISFAGVVAFTVMASPGRKIRALENIARDVDAALDHIDGAFLISRIERDRCAGRHRHIDIEPLGKGFDGRCRAKDISGDHARGDAAILDHGQARGAEMLEARRRFLMRLRQRDPALDAAHFLAGCACCVGCAFGMGDAASRRHQVHRAGQDFERVAFVVAMHDRALEKIGDGRKSDMRMRAYIHALPGRMRCRPHLVEKDERSHHLPLAVWQRAPDLEGAPRAADITGARHDHEVERVAGFPVPRHGVFRRPPAHASSPAVRDVRVLSF